MRTALLLIGSLLPIVSAVTYIISIFQGKTRPQRMTRFLMTVITAVMFVSLLVAHDTSGMWLALTSLVQAVFIWVLSFRRGMGGRDRLDFVCLGLCGLGIVLWLGSDWPWMGLMASIVADAIACVPSLRKTIRLPHTEQMLFYLLDTVAGLAILIAGPYTVQAMVFPLYIALINAVFVLAIIWPRSLPVSAEE